MVWWIALVLCWAAVAACWLIRRAAYRDRELYARMMGRHLRGAGSEPAEELSRAARFARDAFGGER